MTRRLATAFAVLLAAALEAATYRIGPVGQQILTLGGVRQLGDAGDCTRTWYDPEIFAKGDSLRLLAQATAPDLACGHGGFDSLYAATRDANGTWNVPSVRDCAILPGFAKCGRPKWVWASPSVVSGVSAEDHRYFMAFIGGNGDFDQGRIYWAVSDDGEQWSVYDVDPPPAEPWAPLIAPKYGNECFSTYGAGQVAVAFEDGWFYLFLNYVHRRSYLDHPAPTWESIAFRFRYDADDPWGLSGVKEIYHDPDGPTRKQGGGAGPGAWVAHSGRLVFGYDPIEPEPGDPRLGYFTSMWSLHCGPKDLKKDGARGRWVHAFTASDTNQLHWQENDSLAANDWGARFDIDSSAINGTDGAFPGRTIQYPALWYGSLDGKPSTFHIWVPVDWGRSGCQVPGQTPTFSGLGLVSAELTYEPRPRDDEAGPEVFHP